MNEGFSATMSMDRVWSIRNIVHRKMWQKFADNSNQCRNFYRPQYNHHHLCWLRMPTQNGQITVHKMWINNRNAIHKIDMIMMYGYGKINSDWFLVKRRQEAFEVKSETNGHASLTQSNITHSSVHKFYVFKLYELEFFPNDIESCELRHFLRVQFQTRDPSIIVLTLSFRKHVHENRRWPTTHSMNLHSVGTHHA